MNVRLGNARLVSLCILGCVLLSYPMISLFNRSQLVFGVPLLYAYVFGVWIVFIAMLVAITTRRSK